jgi:hypothetical protein
MSDRCLRKPAQATSPSVPRRNALLRHAIAGIVRPPAPSQSVRGSTYPDLTIPVRLPRLVLLQAQQAVAGKKPHDY